MYLMQYLTYRNNVMYGMGLNPIRTLYHQFHVFSLLKQKTLNLYCKYFLFLLDEIDGKQLENWCKLLQAWSLESGLFLQFSVPILTVEEASML